MKGIKNIRSRLRCMALLGSFSRLFEGNRFALTPTSAGRLLSPHAGGWSLITSEEVRTHFASRPRKDESAQLNHYGHVETGKKPYRPVELFEKWTWLQDACTSAGGATFSKTTTWPSALDEQRFR
jgi:hypothetical protein